jgi:hypothetical protein
LAGDYSIGMQRLLDKRVDSRTVLTVLLVALMMTVAYARTVWWTTAYPVAVALVGLQVGIIAVLDVTFWLRKHSRWPIAAGVAVLLPLALFSSVKG